SLGSGGVIACRGNRLARPGIGTRPGAQDTAHCHENSHPGPLAVIGSFHAMLRRILDWVNAKHTATSRSSVGILANTTRYSETAVFRPPQVRVLAHAGMLPRENQYERNHTIWDKDYASLNNVQLRQSTLKLGDGCFRDASVNVQRLEILEPVQTFQAGVGNP